MTFETIETSVDDARPVELLQIIYGIHAWHYTSGEVNIVRDGNTFVPLPMLRSTLKPSGDISKSSITIKVPQDTPVGELFRIQPPSGVVSITLFQEHYEDNDFKVIWKGRIINVNWQQPWAVLTVENVFSSMKRIGLRRKYSTQCPHVLYGNGCNVVRATYKQTYPLTSYTGVTFVLAGAIGQPPNYFAGGYVEWVSTSNGALERRMIRSSNATTGEILLTSLPVGISVGTSVDIYPGCEHTLSVCHSKFANSDNFGGTPFIPVKNPFAAMIY